MIPFQEKYSVASAVNVVKLYCYDLHSCLLCRQFFNGTVIDGYNRYEICQKYNIPFTTSEKSFDNEHEVRNWIIDNQLSRRNINEDQRAYLIGKRYKEEKKAIGENQYTIPYNTQETDGTHLSNDQEAYGIGEKYSNENSISSEQEDDNSLKRVGNRFPSTLHSSNPTASKIGDQYKVTDRTVKNAEKFADAVDTVAENVGINPQEILSGAISASRKDVEKVSKLEPEVQRKVFEKIQNKEVKNVKDAVKEVNKEKIEKILGLRQLERTFFESFLYMYS